MSNLSGSPDDGESAFCWFECLCHQALSRHNRSQEVDYAKLQQDVERKWKGFPRRYKEQMAPLVTALRAAREQERLAQEKVDDHTCLSIETWRKNGPDQLEPYIDAYALVDDRLAALYELRTVHDRVMEALNLIWGSIWEFQTPHYESEACRTMMPRMIDGAQSMNAHVVREIEQWEADLPEYRRMEEAWWRLKRESGFPAGAGWIGSWFLGKGSFGTANLFVRQDHEGRIFNRVVVKDAKINASMQQDDNAWTLHEGVYVPVEVRAPQLLGGREGSETILRVRGWREFPGRSMFRVLLDYCPFGDLMDFRSFTCRVWNEGKPEPGDVPSLYNPKLPQAFLWYVFECLATAGVLMEQGSLNPNALNAWQQVFHSDIKMSNVMLGPPNPKKYCRYPSPVLADWGFAQFCALGEQKCSRGGTPGAESPENCGFCYTANGLWIPHSAPLNRKSDVWSVGNAIYGLMTLAETDKNMSFRQNKLPREPDLERLDGEYSDTLLTLIMDCMRYYPENRISFPDLLERIKQSTGEDPDWKWDHVQGIRTAKADDPRWDSKRYKLGMPTDPFPMYTLLSRNPPNNKQKAPPHKSRKLEEEVEYKGPVSADTKPFHLAGSERRHAAATGDRNQHLLWLHKKHARKARRALNEAKKNQPGFQVPDSDDDSGDSELEEGEVAEAQGTSKQDVADLWRRVAAVIGRENFPRPSVAEAEPQATDFIKPMPDSPQHAVRSRSAAGGAGWGRNDRSASPGRPLGKTPLRKAARRKSSRTGKWRAPRRRDDEMFLD